MKTRLHKKQQNCNKLLTLFTMGVAMLTGVVAMGFATIRESYHQTKAVDYNDDEDYLILSVDEINNYSFENLYNLLKPDSESDEPNSILENVHITYDSVVYESDGYSVDWTPVSSSDYEIGISRLTDYHFSLYDSNEDTSVLFSYSLRVSSADDYSSIKNAIQLDISANQPQDNMPVVLTDFVQILVNGIGQMASGVAEGISSMAQALFLKVENGAVVGLSVFGGILAIFAGLALAVGITTKVYTWITSMGN